MKHCFDRETVLKAIRFDKPDFIPMQFVINPSCWGAYPQEALIELIESHPFLFPGYQRPQLPYKPHLTNVQKKDVPYVDDWGCRWETTVDGITGTVTRHPLDDWSKFKEYKAPDAEKCMGIGAIDWKEEAKNIESMRNAGDILIGGLRHGHTFLQVCDIRGYQNVIFDNDNNLVGIKVINTGDCYVPATGFGAEEIPADIREEVEEDRDYNFETSTITYFNESGKYEISNNIVCGFVTKVSRTAIYVDFELQNIPKHTDYEVGQYLVLYFDVNGILADVRVIEEPFFYNLKDMTYHTWECEFYADRANDKNWAIGIEAAADKYTGEDEWVEFDCCEECHTEEWGDDSIAVIHIADNQTCYVVKDGDFYHSKKCEEYTTYKAEMMKTTLGKAKDSGYKPCVKCAGHFE